jgi:hypothetical protein
VADYTIMTQYPDVDVVGNTQTRDVQVIGVETAGHGVYFEVRIPVEQATTKFIHYEANAFTIIYEMLFDITGVSEVQWFQRANNSGQLLDTLRIWVTSTSGASTATLTFPYSQFNQDVIAPKVAALVAALDATEAGT